jgi:hypothetical protein
MVFREKYSGVGLFMLRSLKLNAPGPKLLVADRLELPRLYMSLQFHGMREGGCMAAKGEEASMMAANCNTAPTIVSGPDCNIYGEVVYGRYSNVLTTEECNRYKPINYERCVGKSAGQEQEMQCQGTFDVSCSYIECQAGWRYGRSYILLLNQRLRH